jgi:hypothetical protein
MPVSKHRRKSGGKSVRHPGRGKAFKKSPPTAKELAWRVFNTRWRSQFLTEFPEREDVGMMMDIITDQVWLGDGNFGPASKEKAIEEFIKPFEDEPPKTREDAERALAFLAERGMLDVEGGQITVPARFQQTDKTG